MIKMFTDDIKQTSYTDGPKKRIVKSNQKDTKYEKLVSNLIGFLGS